VLKVAKLLVCRVDVVVLWLQLEDGFVQYRFDCGSGAGSVRVDTAPVSDGYWHTVAVERIGRNVRLVVDDMYTAEGSGPGANDVLNLDTNDVFFGARVDVSADGLDNVEHGFIGCMKKIRIDHVDLPLQGSSAVGLLQNTRDVEYHCDGIYIPGMIRSVVVVVVSTRCNIHISHLCYDVSCPSVRLSLTEMHWHIIANLGFKFRSQFTTHCGRGACGRARGKGSSPERVE